MLPAIVVCHHLMTSGRYLGPLLFLSFVFIIFFILMNMFLAIVGEAHEAAKEEAEGQEDPFLAQLKLVWEAVVVSCCEGTTCKLL